MYDTINYKTINNINYNNCLVNNNNNNNNNDNNNNSSNNNNKNTNNNNNNNNYYYYYHYCYESNNNDDDNNDDNDDDDEDNDKYSYSELAYLLGTVPMAYEIVNVVYDFKWGPFFSSAFLEKLAQNWKVPATYVTLNPFL